LTARSQGNRPVDRVTPSCQNATGAAAMKAAVLAAAEPRQPPERTP
jgi:hypothetical protein